MPFLPLLSPSSRVIRKASSGAGNLWHRTTCPWSRCSRPLGMYLALRKPKQWQAQDWSSYASPSLLVLVPSINSGSLAAITSQQPHAALCILGHSGALQTPRLASRPHLLSNLWSTLLTLHSVFNVPTVLPHWRAPGFWSVTMSDWLKHKPCEPTDKS